MAHLRKVLMIYYAGKILRFVPLEEIKDCNIIIPDEKTKIVVHEKTIPKGSIYDLGLADSNIIREITEEDITAITANKRECFVEVDHNNELSMPSNGVGRKMIVIHLTREEVADVA